VFDPIEFPNMTQIPKRLLAACLAALGLVSAPSHAQPDAPWPTRPVQMIVAYPPAGGTDILARLVAAELGRAIGQPVVVINRSGASGAIGTEAAARAAPDGYTLLMATANVTINPAVDPKTRVNPTRDFVPVTLLSESPFALVVPSALPVKSLADMVAYSRAHPGRISYASTGIGSPQQLAAELLKKTSELDWVHVPYQGGGPALNDMIGGNVQVMFSNVLPVLPHLQANKLRALGVTTTQRLPALANIPTLVEQGHGDMVFSFWSGVLAPAGTPPAIVARLNDALMKIMREPAIIERLNREGSIVKPLPSAEFSAYIAEDAIRWKRIATITGVRAEP
jgi:tripartite-type tricarboxylate transporter receptor subunit TctC